MRLRTWLLTGTSLGLIALATSTPAMAQSADLSAAYQAYVADPAAGEAAFTEQCIVEGFPSVDACIAAVTGAAAPAPEPEPEPAVEPEPWRRRSGRNG